MLKCEVIFKRTLTQAVLPDSSGFGNNTLHGHAFLTEFLMGGRALALAAVFPATALAGSQG